MTVDQEIEDAVRRGYDPLFLVGLLALAAEPEERQRLIATVNLASEKIYRERRVVTI